MIYKNHFVLDSSFLFPKLFQCRYNCSSKPNFFSSTFAYCKTEDAIFYLYGSLFYNSDARSKLLSFVNRGYCECTKF